jgi:hypothetical protein
VYIYDVSYREGVRIIQLERGCREESRVAGGPVVCGASPVKLRSPCEIYQIHVYTVRLQGGVHGLAPVRHLVYFVLSALGCLLRLISLDPPELYSRQILGIEYRVDQTCELENVPFLCNVCVCVCVCVCVRNYCSPTHQSGPPCIVYVCLVRAWDTGMDTRMQLWYHNCPSHLLDTTVRSAPKFHWRTIRTHTLDTSGEFNCRTLSQIYIPCASLFIICSRDPRVQRTTYSCTAVQL